MTRYEARSPGSACIPKAVTVKNVDHSTLKPTTIAALSRGVSKNSIRDFGHSERAARRKCPGVCRRSTAHLIKVVSLGASIQLGASNVSSSSTNVTSIVAETNINRDNRSSYLIAIPLENSLPPRTESSKSCPDVRHPARSRRNATAGLQTVDIKAPKNTVLDVKRLGKHTLTVVVHTNNSSKKKGRSSGTNPRTLNPSGSNTHSANVSRDEPAINIRLEKDTRAIVSLDEAANGAFSELAKDKDGAYSQRISQSKNGLSTLLKNNSVNLNCPRRTYGSEKTTEATTDSLVGADKRSYGIRRKEKAQFEEAKNIAPEVKMCPIRKGFLELRNAFPPNLILVCAIVGSCVLALCVVTLPLWAKLKRQKNRLTSVSVAGSRCRARNSLNGSQRRTSSESRKRSMTLQIPVLPQNFERAPALPEATQRSRMNTADTYFSQQSALMPSETASRAGLRPLTEERGSNDEFFTPQSIPTFRGYSANDRAVTRLSGTSSNKLTVSEPSYADPDWQYSDYRSRGNSRSSQRTTFSASVATLGAGSSISGSVSGNPTIAFSNIQRSENNHGTSQSDSLHMNGATPQSSFNGTYRNSDADTDEGYLEILMPVSVEHNASNTGSFSQQ